MKNEIIGVCPCCMKSSKSACVDIYVSRNNEGDITDMYIFGDDDFDFPSKYQNVTEIEVSKDGKTITEMVCPRCKERIAISVPVIDKPNNEKIMPNYDSMYSGVGAMQRGC